MEQIDQMPSDEALKEVERDVGLGVEARTPWMAPTDIYRGVNQGAVNVKQVNFERRNQAGCGLSPPIKPGKALALE